MRQVKGKPAVVASPLLPPPLEPNAGSSAAEWAPTASDRGGPRFGRSFEYTLKPKTKQKKAAPGSTTSSVRITCCGSGNGGSAPANVNNGREGQQ
jgi:hypothetical protein